MWRRSRRLLPARTPDPRRAGVMDEHARRPLSGARAQRRHQLINYGDVGRTDADTAVVAARLLTPARNVAPLASGGPLIHSQLKSQHVLRVSMFADEADEPTC